MALEPGQPTLATTSPIRAHRMLSLLIFTSLSCDLTRRQHVHVPLIPPARRRLRENDQRQDLEPDRLLHLVRQA